MSNDISYSDMIIIPYYGDDDEINVFVALQDETGIMI